jgi:uncharacterized protein YutE (UPF0331/DUF86 family)
MDERIKEHLKRLNQFYIQLIDLRKLNYEEFAASAVNRAAAERLLQIAIESCLNIGNRLISLLQFEQPVRTPESYTEIFAIMGEIGILEREFSKRLEKMAKFRNRLVHVYWELDAEMTYRIIQEDIDDLKKFQVVVVDYFNKKDAE